MIRRTPRQLQEYGGLYVSEGRRKGGRTKGKTIISYLVCFDRECVTFTLHGGDIRTGENTFWHIRTYEEIRDGVAAYLEKKRATLPCDVRYFLEHYVAYLDEYYAAYHAVGKDYSLAFVADTIPGAASFPTNLPAKLRDGRFWKRLILSAVGNGFARGCGAGVLGRFEPEYNNGNTPEPFLDIITTKDANWHTANAPRLFVQMQGRELKLFTRELDPVKKSGAAGNAFVNHCLAVQRNIARKPGKQCRPNKPDTMRGRIEGKAASFKIYAEELTLDVPIAGIVGQLQDFVLRMDAAVTKTGPFSPPSA